MYILLDVSSLLFLPDPDVKQKSGSKKISGFTTLPACLIVTPSIRVVRRIMKFCVAAGAEHFWLVDSVADGMAVSDGVRFKKQIPQIKDSLLV